MSDVPQRSHAWSPCLILALALLAAPAFGSSAGKLIGTVKDEQGGALPGASVTVSSPALIGGARSTRGGADGTFVFPDLAPGLYDVEVELAGFHGEELREQVTVTAERPVVDPTQVAVGQVFTLELMDRSSIGAPTTAATCRSPAPPPEWRRAS